MKGSHHILWHRAESTFVSFHVRKRKCMLKKYKRKGKHKAKFQQCHDSHEQFTWKELYDTWHSKWPKGLSDMHILEIQWKWKTVEASYSFMYHNGDKHTLFIPSENICGTLWNIHIKLLLTTLEKYDSLSSTPQVQLGNVHIADVNWITLCFLLTPKHKSLWHIYTWCYFKKLEMSIIIILKVRLLTSIRE